MEQPNLNLVREVTFLHCAIMHDDMPILQLFLRGEIDVNTQDYKGNTLLHYAVMAKKGDNIKIFLDAGANPNIINNEGDSPFHKSFELENDALINLFLYYGANVKLKNSNSLNVLHLAARYSGYSVLKNVLKSYKLVDKVTVCQRTLLHALLKFNSNSENVILKMVKLILKYEAGVNVIDIKNHTPIYYAVKSKYLSVVRLLASAGAELNSMSKVPLIAALKTCDDTKMVRLLLSLGARADINRANDFCSLLHIAIDNIGDEDTCLEVIKLLLQYGANINSQNRNRSTVLEFALKKCYVKIFNYLMEQEAIFKTKNIFEQSLLFVAVKCDSYSVAKTLISLGLRVDDFDNQNCSILSEAVLNENNKIIKLLLDNGAVANDKSVTLAAAETGNFKMINMIKSPHGDVKLDDLTEHFVRAATSFQAEMMEYLLDIGADVNLEHDGFVPLYYAYEDFDLSDEDEIGSIQIILKNIAVLSLSGAQINEKNMTLIHSSRYLTRHFNRYQHEVMKMRNKKICNEYNLTYFDFLLKKNNALARCLRCESIDHKLKHFNFEEFEHYGEKLEKIYWRGTNHLQMIDCFQELLHEVLGRVISSDLVGMISEYMSYENLKVCFRDYTI